jgi:hypothetical protein
LQKLAKRRLRQFLVEGEINLITRRTEAVWRPKPSRSWWWW